MRPTGIASRRRRRRLTSTAAARAVPHEQVVPLTPPDAPRQLFLTTLYDVFIKITLAFYAYRILNLRIIRIRGFSGQKSRRVSYPKGRIFDTMYFLTSKLSGAFKQLPDRGFRFKADVSGFFREPETTLYWTNELIIQKAIFETINHSLRQMHTTKINYRRNFYINKL